MQIKAAAVVTGRGAKVVGSFLWGVAKSAVTSKPEGSPQK